LNKKGENHGTHWSSERTSCRRLHTRGIEEQESECNAEDQESEALVNPMLRITAQEDAETVRLKLEGMLKGAWVPEMEQCWRRATSTGNKDLVVDLTDVEYVDTAGRYLLALIHAHGARFVAVTPLMTQLVGEIAAGSKH